MKLMLTVCISQGVLFLKSEDKWEGGESEKSKSDTHEQIEKGREIMRALSQFVLTDFCCLGKCGRSYQSITHDVFVWIREVSAK